MPEQRNLRCPRKARRCCPARPQTSLPLRRRRTMGQSLSNLCGIKPADPPQWAAFEAKMKAEGLSEAAIASFKHNFVTLASGANLMISEAPPRVKPAAGHRQSAAPERRLPSPLGSARALAGAACARRVRAAPAPARRRLGPPGPPRPTLPRAARVLLLRDDLTTYYLPYRLITYQVPTNYALTTYYLPTHLSGTSRR